MSRSIDWMGGEPPSSWDIFKLKHVLREETKVIGADVPAGAISFGEVVFKKFDNDETLATYRTVRRGQFLINPLNLNYDLKSLRIGLSEIDCRVSPAYIIATHDPLRATSKYLRWALRVFDVQHIKTLGAGVRQTVKFEDIGDCRIALPSLDVQKAIASHLDRATFRIDTLVAKKTRFIELLREKRQALITHAVTKGLDPNVPMKDSGVEWLGEVPADWKVLSLKRIGRLKGGSGFPPSLQGRAENEIPFFKVGDLGKSPDGKYLGDTEHTITHGEAKELGATVFPANVLVWAKIGAALSLNRRRITTKPSCLDNNMTGFVPDTMLVSTRYSFYLMSSVDFTVHAKPGAVPSFSEGDQGELQISLPPRRFQDAIVAHLDRATTRIDTLIAKTERSIELLREHRTALITAAVTGKLDLRPAA